MAKTFQNKGKIDNLGLFHGEPLAKFYRRGLVTDSGREQFHITSSKRFRIAPAELADLPEPEALPFLSAEIADSSR